MNSGWLAPVPQGWKSNVDNELAIDIGAGDFSAACLPDDQRVSFYIEAQQEGIICGSGIALHILNVSGNVTLCVNDSDRVKDKSRVLSGLLPAQFLLSRERTALNYLMHLSGVATLTAKFVEAVSGTECKILDTRKTTPGLRYLEKYAVRCGGGTNHRISLSDGIMLKDNHIRAAGSIASAVERARKLGTHMTKIEVECESIEMVDQAVRAGADIVMLDNMSIDQMSEAVQKYKGRTVLEASGGVALHSVRQIAETGVDAVSIGALTHSAPALSIHLEIE